jgi:hypothetical protein
VPIKLRLIIVRPIDPGSGTVVAASFKVIVAANEFDADPLAARSARNV